MPRHRELKRRLRSPVPERSAQWLSAGCGDQRPPFAIAGRRQDIHVDVREPGALQHALPRLGRVLVAVGPKLRVAALQPPAARESRTVDVTGRGVRHDEPAAVDEAAAHQRQQLLGVDEPGRTPTGERRIERLLAVVEPCARVGLDECEPGQVGPPVAGPCDLNGREVQRGDPRPSPCETGGLGGGPAAELQDALRGTEEFRSGPMAGELGPLEQVGGGAFDAAGLVLVPVLGQGHRKTVGGGLHGDSSVGRWRAGM